MTTTLTVPRRADTVREMLLDLQTARLMRETTERILHRGNAIWALQEGLIDRVADFHRLDASPELKRALAQRAGGGMTITHEQLMVFCEKPIDGARKGLCNPFNVGEYTYATNGHFAIRIPAKIEYVAAEDYRVEIAKMFSDPAIPADKFIDLPIIESPEEHVICSKCNGTGSDIECTDCDGSRKVHWESEGGYEYDATCEMCNGTGKIKGPCEKCGATGKTAKDKLIDVGSKLLNARYLAIIANTLKNVKIAPDAVSELSPVPFIFDGGEGIIMPLRRNQYL